MGKPVGEQIELAHRVAQARRADDAGVRRDEHDEETNEGGYGRRDDTNDRDVAGDERYRIAFVSGEIGRLDEPDGEDGERHGEEQN